VESRDAQREVAAEVYTDGRGVVFIWTISDAVTVFFIVLVVLAFAWSAISTSMRQSSCKHDGGMNETRACDAICRKCGKNLGFIGSWRK
jgi:hypothetical protein